MMEATAESPATSPRRMPFNSSSLFMILSSRSKRHTETNPPSYPRNIRRYETMTTTVSYLRRGSVGWWERAAGGGGGEVLTHTHTRT